MVVAEREDIAEMYEESRSRIKRVCEILGDISEEGPFLLPQGAAYEILQTFLNSILGSHRFERAGQFRTAIIETGEWLLNACRLEYLEEASTYLPHPLYVISKGSHLLEQLLNRDFAIRELNAHQQNLQSEFRLLCIHLPDPRRARLSQVDVDTLIESTLKKA